MPRTGPWTLLLVVLPLAAAAAELSESSRRCVECHRQVTPAVVARWEAGRHASVSLEQALARPALERRVTLQEPPEGLASVSVGCFECHGAPEPGRPDAADHFGTSIHLVVTPKDCARCHPAEEEQYRGSKKAHALGNIDRNPLFSALRAATVSGRAVSAYDFALAIEPVSEGAQQGACDACHGTPLTVAERRSLETAHGPMERVVLRGWPNQGVGRVNPDGSLGSCGGCHRPHRFAVEEARAPETCARCHGSTKAPAWQAYRQGPHGGTTSGNTRWGAVPWVAGEHFTVPSCAACHASLLVRSDGEVIASRTHDFGSRLWIRLFGLTRSHAQPAEGSTTAIRNAEGLPLPVSLQGSGPATQHLITPGEQEGRRSRMAGICGACHGDTLVRSRLEAVEEVAAQADRLVEAGDKLMAGVWQQGTAEPLNPFDEAQEQLWVELWMFRANAIRFAAAMGPAPSLSTFDGWWAAQRALRGLKDKVF